MPGPCPLGGRWRSAGRSPPVTGRVSVVTSFWLMPDNVGRAGPVRRANASGRGRRGVAQVGLDLLDVPEPRPGVLRRHGGGDDDPLALLPVDRRGEGPGV